MLSNRVRLGCIMETTDAAVSSVSSPVTVVWPRQSTCKQHPKVYVIKQLSQDSLRQIPQRHVMVTAGTCHGSGKRGPISANGISNLQTGPSASVEQRVAQFAVNIPVISNPATSRAVLIQPTSPLDNKTQHLDVMTSEDSLLRSPTLNVVNTDSVDESAGLTEPGLVETAVVCSSDLIQIVSPLLQDQPIENTTSEVTMVTTDNSITDNVSLYEVFETEDNDQKQAVKVESLHPPLENFETNVDQFQSSEHVLEVMHDFQDISDLDVRHQGYGPDFIGQETEVVAAETSPESLLISMDTPLNGSISGASQSSDPSDDVLSGISIVTTDIDDRYQGKVLMQNWEEPSGVNLQGSVSDSQGCARDLQRSHFIDNKHCVRDKAPVWMRREWKRARDRAKKQSKRADPRYRSKEREEALVRMRTRRMDPDYREVERERDRIRRKLAREQNASQRKEERERDKMYRRNRRINQKDSPVFMTELPHTLGDVPDKDDLEGAPGPVLEVVMETDGIDFQMDDELIVEVYNDLDGKDDGGYG